MKPCLSVVMPVYNEAKTVAEVIRTVLATYRYMDMEAVIGEALDFADKFIAALPTDSPRPIFPNKEN